MFPGGLTECLSWVRIAFWSHSLRRRSYHDVSVTSCLSAAPSMFVLLPSDTPICTVHRRSPLSASAGFSAHSSAAVGSSYKHSALNAPRLEPTGIFKPAVPRPFNPSLRFCALIFFFQTCLPLQIAILSKDCISFFPRRRLWQPTSLKAATAGSDRSEH